MEHAVNMSNCEKFFYLGFVQDRIVKLIKSDVKCGEMNVGHNCNDLSNSMLEQILFKRRFFAKRHWHPLNEIISFISFCWFVTGLQFKIYPLHQTF